MKQDKNYDDIYLKYYSIGFFLILFLILIYVVKKDKVRTKDDFCHCSNHGTDSGLPTREFGELGRLKEQDQRFRFGI